MSDIIQLHDKRFKPLIPRSDIREATKRLGAQITADYQAHASSDSKNNQKNLVFVVVLKGSVIFAADLIREVAVECRTEFVKVQSYGHGITSSGSVTLHFLDGLDLAGKDIIIVEDIIDTGLTLKAVTARLEEYKPASLKIATLLLKPEVCKGTVTADYVGFEISPLFVVGYGLDYDEIGRNLPDIYVLTE